MSLLDSNTTAVVYPEVESTDDYGNKIMVPSMTGVEVVGRMQPGTTDEQADLGQVTATLYRFISRTFPGGPYAHVVVNGSTWEVVGSPKRRTGSALTAHVTTMLRER